MGAALAIASLRSAARWFGSRRVCRRNVAALRSSRIANALEAMSPAEAARLAGMEHQALRDAVVRYNAEGLAGASTTDRNRGAPSG